MPAFRAELRKTWGKFDSSSRKEAVKQIGEIALASELHLQLSATVVAMEFACGTCYAIDEFTVYLTPNQLRELAQSLSRSEVVGVGITLDIRDNKIVIQDIAMDSSARMFNIKPNDEIISINKKPVADLPLQVVKEMLEHFVGNAVEVEIASVEGKRTLALARRAQTRYFPLENFPYLYMKINSFTDATAQDVDRAMADMTQAGLKGLIIDLRDNNGGVFDSAIETARRFLSAGVITSTQHQDSRFNFVYHAKNPNAVAAPIVVLVDGETASAAEVLAGALKDNGRAVLIGQTTFGKGCTQCVLKLPSANGGIPTGGMKLTVARFFSPKGVAYSGRGITPHIFIDEVAQDEMRQMFGRDLGQERAIEELNRLLMMPK